MRSAMLSLADFFSIPAREYEHFTLSYTAAGTITTVVLAVCLGVILAALYNFYVRRVPGGVVRLLLSRGALSPESALCAEELGLLDKPFALWELLRGVSLRHIVCAVTTPAEGGEAVAAQEDALAANGEAKAQEVTEQEAAPDGKKRTSAEPLPDAQTRFYIPEDKKYRAQVRFEKEGNGVGGLVLTCVCAFALGVLLIKLIPVVLAMVDNFM